MVDAAIGRGDRLVMSSVVEYEWRRGPRSPAQLALTDALFPESGIVVFGDGEARRAAQFYRQLPRARSRQIDLMIAACAIDHGAVLWTLNPADFADIPGLTLYRP